ncbi:MAG: phosphate ABC transporter permease PstA [Bacteroidales bacterium]|jgi:phosphate transport system permease protein
MTKKGKIKGLRKRKVVDKGLFVIVCIMSALTAVPLIAILTKVLIKGIGQINWSFFTKSTPNTLDAMLAIQAGNKIPGGIANGIVGTLIMVIIASIISIPIGILCGIYLSEKKQKKFANIIRFLSDLLQGTPSIVIGIIIYLWIVVPTKSYSALAGGISLAVMMIPLIIRSTEETLNMLPSSLKEAGLALGASYTTTISKILLPSGFGGIFTGILLAVSRVIGETAPLMLTALGSTMISWSLTKPSSSVSLLIWEFYNDPNLQNMIWSASLFLLIFVLSLNLIAKRITKKWRIS